MRAAFTLAHRWLGLAVATFLFIAGVTGAVISWDHELDHLLNPQLTQSASRGPALPALQLAAMIEARDPRIRVTYLPLAAEPGETLSAFVQPRVDKATGQLFQPGYNQVFVDPVTGAEQGRREWGAVWPITRATFVSFLYKLHYTLHIPELWGKDRLGHWLMGTVALVWTLDCFVGFYLTLPARKADNRSRPPAVERALSRGWWARWRPAWKIKTSGSAYRINFDIHRAFGLWTWALLFVLAFTGFSLNLYREVFYPVLSTISKTTPSPLETRQPVARTALVEPGKSMADILELGERDGPMRGITEPPGAIFLSPEFKTYALYFFKPGEDEVAGGTTPPILYYDTQDGRLLAERKPWTGTAADIFVQAQFPIHSGRILGLPGRILISLMGIIVAALSITGVVIWWRKRAARVLRRRRVDEELLAYTASV